jgi:1-acyl-sn-glycerol-3-phosphate acyltransferase
MMIFKILWAAIKTAGFFLWIFLQIPTLLLIAPFCRRFGVWQMHIFMRGVAKIFGLKFKTFGIASRHRPLMLVSNHISIFELIAFPAVFSCGFFAKGEIRRWPIAYWFVRNLGNLFIDRRPTHAKQAVETIRKQMRIAKNPFVVFPEGTTDNGNYILPFKSAIFDFMSDNRGNAKIQPIALLYRYKNGGKIPPQILANDYAYFDNIKQTQPPYAKSELTIIGLLWKTLLRGGFITEIHILPVFDAIGFDRKQIAERLHEMISKKFEELK